jgi:hypothetical protein
LARYVHFTRGQPKAVNKKGFAPRLIMPGTRKTKEEDNGQAGQGDKILLENISLDLKCKKCIIELSLLE